MIKKRNQVSRKSVEEDRIAICPQFGCKYVEKVKPLKFGLIGRRKYPKCSKHKTPLVYVGEFLSDFIKAVEACLYDISSLPPKSLIDLIKINSLNNISAFINGWMYCNPVGRGGQIVSQYLDGLSRSYMKVLSKKQKKVLQNNKPTKKSYHMLRLGLELIAKEYTIFLLKLRKKSEIFNNNQGLEPFSKETRRIMQTWLKGHIKKINISKNKKISDSSVENKSLSEIKEEYDNIFHAGTCSLLLGKTPDIVTKGISAFEIFSIYFEFLEAGLCKELKKEDFKVLIMSEQKVNNINTLTVKIFFKEMKRVINSIEDKSYTYYQISTKYLKKKSKWYINDLLLKSIRDPSFVLKTQMLNSYEKALKEVIGEVIFLEEFSKFFNKYKEKNPVHYMRNNAIQKHTNFIKTCFENIDTKGKAYWLGFFLAEAHIRQKNFEITISAIDGILFKYLCRDLGFNPVYLEYNRYITRNEKKIYRIRLRIPDFNFCKSLLDRGFPIDGKTSSSSLVRFPYWKLKTTELIKAMLLGFFDGDGSHGKKFPTVQDKGLSPIIISKSKYQLNDIRNYFKIEYDVKGPNRKGDYSLSIGSIFFNELLDNYERSLPRKRYNYLSQQEVYKKRLEGLGLDMVKFKLQKDDLKILYFKGWSNQRIANYHYEKFGEQIGNETVRYWAKKWNLEGLNKYGKDSSVKQKQQWEITIEYLSKGWNLEQIYIQKLNYTYDPGSQVGRQRMKQKIIQIFENDSFVNQSKNIIRKIIEVYGSLEANMSYMTPYEIVIMRKKQGWNLTKIYTIELGYRYNPNSAKLRHRMRERFYKWFKDDPFIKNYYKGEVNTPLDILDIIEKVYQKEG